MNYFQSHVNMRSGQKIHRRRMEQIFQGRRTGEDWNKSSKVDVPGSLRTNVPYHLKIVSLKNLFIRSKKDDKNIFFTQERQHFSF
jgi:hypothetical protein